MLRLRHRTFNPSYENYIRKSQSTDNQSRMKKNIKDIAKILFQTEHDGI